MKRIFIIALTMLACTFAHAQSSLFQKYNNTKGVTTVYISKQLFSMMPTLKAGDRDITKIAKKLDRLQVLTSDRSSLAKSIREQAVTYYSRNGYEPMMTVNEGRQRTTIYMKALGKGKNEFALLNYDGNALQIINLLGSITLNEIKGIATD